MSIDLNPFPKQYTVKDKKDFHKPDFSIDFSVFSCSLEIILWHCADCNNFGTGRKLDELCKQYICFISVVHYLFSFSTIVIIL